MPIGHHGPSAARSRISHVAVLRRRVLLGDIARVAAQTVMAAVRALTRELELSVGIVGCIQTHGSLANWHPHMHYDCVRWRVSSGWDLRPWLRGPRTTEEFEMRNIGVEESREMYGLFLIATWMVAVFVAAWRRTGQRT